MLPDLEAAEAHLWRRPSPDEWSAGEQLDHMISVHSFFTAIYTIFWIPSSGLARLRPSRIYSPEIDDVYNRPGFPLSAGSLWRSRYPSALKPSLGNLIDDLRHEHRRIRSFYASKPEVILGRAPLFFPYIGWINYIQSLRISVFHDAHHFASIEKALTFPAGKEPDA